MDYTVIIENKSYELPKKTVGVMEKLDEVLKVDTSNMKFRQKMERLHTFVKDIVGVENAKEILGSAKLDEIDVSDLSLAVLKINDAYEQPIADYKTEKMRERMGSIPTDKLTALTKSMQSLSNVQGLSK